MIEDMKPFASFLFQWTLDRNTRFVFSIVLDVNGRNIRPFGKTLIHYPRWVEAGYLIELMRLTDFMNSLPLNKRQQFIGLARFNLMRPSESLVNDLWDLARNRICINDFHRRYSKYNMCNLV